MSAYNFDLRYRPGKTNADADALSRLPGISILPKQDVTTVSSKEKNLQLCIKISEITQTGEILSLQYVMHQTYVHLLELYLSLKMLSK